MFLRALFTRLQALVPAVLLAALPALAADMQMKVTDGGYLDARGFSVVLYQNTYHPIFVDEKNAAMQMILHGQRIATNGDVHLMPTPEQWDLVAKLKSQSADKEHNRLTADLSFPSYQMDYQLVVSPEPGGVRVSVNLDKPLPEKLAGRAGFNLEFLPSIYMGKTYAVDDKDFGMIPRTPQDPMQKVPPPADDPKKLPYQEEWDKAKGYTQPLPIVTGNSITLAPEDPLFRVDVRSDTAPVSLYDGRDRAQNGWFVLRSLIPNGKTEGAIVWHIRPIDIPNWTRPPMIAHSQVGYPPNFPKVGDPRARSQLRRAEDGKSPPPHRRRLVQAGLRGTDLRIHTVAALSLRKVRFLLGPRARPLRHRIRRRAHSTLSHRERRLQPCLAKQSRWIPRGRDGSRLSARRLSALAWSLAPR